MNASMKERFLAQWETHFPGAELPIICRYSDEEMSETPSAPDAASHCLICDLDPVRDGATRVFSRETLRCSGARWYLGFEAELGSNFVHFLSRGIPGKLDGERYKRSPALVARYLESQPTFEAPGRLIIFKQWNALARGECPDLVIFFAEPDVLSGLFTLANFDEVDPHGVIAPFGSGCSSIVYHPYRELQSAHPRAVLGMFDVSARPCVEPQVLTLAVPWPKFEAMMDQMEESFLIARSWQKVRSRI